LPRRRLVSLLSQNFVALILAVGMGALIMVPPAVVICGSVVLNPVGSASALVKIWHAVQYPAAAGLLVLALLLVYRYAPNVEEQKW
jgi:uncharacterized BrkB/YihY/UPF0761 family membrane protein